MNFLRYIYRKFWAYLYGAKRYKNLYREIDRIKPKTIFEVGTWNGKHAVKMIEQALKYNQDVTYFGFDLFEDLTEEMYVHELSKMPPTQKVVQERLAETGAKIELIRGNTLETLPEFVKRGLKADFVFIDGGHNVETVQKDWEAIAQLMHPGTVVIFDDYWRNRTDQAAKSVVDNIDQNTYNVEILPEIDSFDNPDFGRLDISFAKVTLKS